jgi:galactose-1-phosphate uridylyltransferase
MVCGMNIGPLAGQSQPHLHLQYGWEVMLGHRAFSTNELNLYFEELRNERLILFETDKGEVPIKVVVPWTPKGQYAIDLYFSGKHRLVEMNENDWRMFAVIGHAIIARYTKLGIKNLNIVFANSPSEKTSEPLVAHFVPRINMTALYEIGGVNVVDTAPSAISFQFQRQGNDGTDPWNTLVATAYGYNGEEDFKQFLEAR